MDEKTSAIIALISQRALCRECIAVKTAQRLDEVDAGIAVLSRAVKIDRYHNGSCSECGANVLVFAIDRPPGR